MYFVYFNIEEDIVCILGNCGCNKAACASTLLFLKFYIFLFLFNFSGIVSSSGSLWKEHRTFTLGALREFGFGKKSLESKIIEEAEVLMKLIEEKNGQSFNIRQLLYLSFSNITCSIVFGQRYEYNDKRFMSLLDKIKENTNSVNITMLATTFPFLQYIPGDPFGIKRTVTNADVVRNHLKNIVKEHEETFDENNLRDYVDVYLKRMRSDEGNPKSTFDRKLKYVLLYIRHNEKIPEGKGSNMIKSYCLLEST